MKLTLIRHGETEGSRRDLYYGAADTNVGLAFTTVDRVLDYIKKNSF